jgi:hypothetical protein
MLDATELKTAIAAEAAARDNLQSIVSRLGICEGEKVTALGKRDLLVNMIATSGATPAEVTAIARRRVDDAESAVESILRQELMRRAAIANAELAATEQAFRAAATARVDAYQRARSATQAVEPPAGNLRLMFADVHPDLLEAPHA